MLVYHFSLQLWLFLGIKLMEINSNLFGTKLSRSKKVDAQKQFSIKWSHYKELMEPN